MNATTQRTEYEVHPSKINQDIPKEVLYRKPKNTNNKSDTGILSKVNSNAKIMNKLSELEGLNRQISEIKGVKI